VPVIKRKKKGWMPKQISAYMILVQITTLGRAALLAAGSKHVPREERDEISPVKCTKGVNHKG
jgi:hypothetical protein